MKGTGRTVALLLATAVATAAIAFVLISVFSRQQEARLTAFQIVDVAPGEPDPAIWGRNYPLQYESWQKTMTSTAFKEYSEYGRYGGSESFQKLDKYPDYTRLFAGYPFSVDYREERGHYWALNDMIQTKRLGDAKPGSCLTCKSPQVPLIMKEIGTEQFYGTPAKDLIARFDIKHSISCADCHDSKTAALVITRPAFREAMASRGIDVDKASRQEMRTYVCAQCHVEYYFRGDRKTVVFPWSKGTSIENIEAYYDEAKFSDWTHPDTNTPMIKMQHPDFELFSSGVHARSGVSCADCHMPYTRVGAAKVSSHWVNTPLAHVEVSCLTCHKQSEAEMKARVRVIQDRTYSSMTHAEKALISAIDGIKAAQAAGVTDAKLADARALHRRAQMRWDFISAESSMGFHSPQEAVRILGDATDFARQAELSAYKALVEKQGKPAGQ
jgi:nitrite reductase (cytochrome c-552)